MTFIELIDKIIVLVPNAQLKLKIELTTYKQNLFLVLPETEQEHLLDVRGILLRWIKKEDTDEPGWQTDVTDCFNEYVTNFNSRNKK